MKITMLILLLIVNIYALEKDYKVSLEFNNCSASTEPFRDNEPI